MTHEELDGAVADGLAAGMSARRMAAELGLERGVVARSIARIRKAEKAAESAEQEAEEPSSLQRQIDDIDRDIAVATGAGNDLRALRLAKLRATLVNQLPPPIERQDNTDCGALTETERSAYFYLIAKSNHIESGVQSEAGKWWEALYERIPAHVEEIHPAHLPLPDGAPEGVKYLVP